jgi:hypothetical protein
MLRDADVERYARQVIVPEIGARGQARWLAARVAVRGGGPLAARTADLLRRAGVTPTDDARTADAAVLLGADHAPVGTIPVLVAELRGRSATLTVLPEGTCPACAPPTAAPGPCGTDALAVCTAHALAALAATEALLVLLDPTRLARRYTIDTDGGTFRADPLPRSACRHGGRPR